MPKRWQSRYEFIEHQVCQSTKLTECSEKTGLLMVMINSRTQKGEMIMKFDGLEDVRF